VTLDRNDSEQAILKGKKYMRIGVIEGVDTLCEIAPSTPLTTWRILNNLQLSVLPIYHRGAIDFLDRDHVLGDNAHKCTNCWRISCSVEPIDMTLILDRF
jgi:hypothetical protein